MADEVTMPKKADKKEVGKATMADLGTMGKIGKVVAVTERLNGCERTTLWAKGKERALSGELV